MYEMFYRILITFWCKTST